jgi:hypothetical protein
MLRFSNKSRYPIVVIIVFISVFWVIGARQFIKLVDDNDLRDYESAVFLNTSGDDDNGGFLDLALDIYTLMLRNLTPVPVPHNNLVIIHLDYNHGLGQATQVVPQVLDFLCQPGAIGQDNPFHPDQITD